MTDNEKAATFIGWGPCLDQRWKAVEMGYFECLGCHRREPEWNMVHRAAPDMTDPRNYMKALEALLPHGFEISFEHAYGHFECCIERAPSVIADWSGAGSTIGHAVSEALAALYDAEHETCKGGK